MLVSVSVGAESNLAVPLSPSSDAESSINAVPSTRQKAERVVRFKAIALGAAFHIRLAIAYLTDYSSITQI